MGEIWGRGPEEGARSSKPFRRSYPSTHHSMHHDATTGRANQRTQAARVPVDLGDQHHIFAGSLALLKRARLGPSHCIMRACQH